MGTLGWYWSHAYGPVPVTILEVNGEYGGLTATVRINVNVGPVSATGPWPAYNVYGKGEKVNVPASRVSRRHNPGGGAVRRRSRQHPGEFFRLETEPLGAGRY